MKNEIKNLQQQLDEVVLITISIQNYQKFKLSKDYLEWVGTILSNSENISFLFLFRRIITTNTDCLTLDGAR